MTPGIKPLVAGNWKMNGTNAALKELHAIGHGFMSGLEAETDAAVCVPATLITRAAQILNQTPVATGGQDCHAEKSGAHTGDISAEMLKEAGASLVIVGHSERRADHGETDQAVHDKARAAKRAGLSVIICIGETRAQRDAGIALDILSVQIAGSVPLEALARETIVAYEPVWAIGTGVTPTPTEVATAHDHIRAELIERLGHGEAGRVSILYGGSVKPSNARDFFSLPHVDGALVGGASLKAADFLAVAEAYMSL